MLSCFIFSDLHIPDSLATFQIGASKMMFDFFILTPKANPKRPQALLHYKNNAEIYLSLTSFDRKIRFAKIIMRSELWNRI